MDISSELAKTVRDYWFYYPYDYYRVKFEGDTREDHHFYSAYSPVKLEIVDLVRDPSGEQNKLTFSLTSDADMTVALSRTIAQSENNLWDEYSTSYSLKAGEKLTVTKSFSAWADEGYYIELVVKNTFVTVLAW